MTVVYPLSLSDGHGVHSHWGQDSSGSGTQVAIYNTTTRRLSINADGLYYVYAQVGNYLKLSHYKLKYVTHR